MRKILVIENYDPMNFPIVTDFEKSAFEVLVVAIFKKNGKEFQMRRFPVDLNAFNTMHRVFGARKKVFPMLLPQIFQELTEEILKQDDNIKKLCSLIIRCICCNSITDEVCSNLPGQSIGFMLTFNMDDHKASRLKGGTEAQIEEAFNKKINEIN